MPFQIGLRHYVDKSVLLPEMHKRGWKCKQCPPLNRIFLAESKVITLTNDSIKRGNFYAKKQKQNEKKLSQLLGFHLYILESFLKIPKFWMKSSYFLFKFTFNKNILMMFFITLKKIFFKSDANKRLFDSNDSFNR